MKLNQLLAVVAIGLSLFASNSRAQTNVANSTPQTTRDGMVLAPEQTTANDSSVIAASDTRPSRPERPNLPPEVQSRIERFKVDARAYLARQEALKKELQGANDKERAIIREKLNELREQWLERAREMRKEYKERQAELADKLTEYRELLDKSRSTSIQDTGGRTRRGDE
jgi:hypothetical protein